MEALLVGSIAAVGVAFGVLFWLLLVRPGILVSVFSDGALTDETWYDIQPSFLLFLRLFAGLVLFGIGFLTGFVLAFLSGTSW